MPLWYFSFYFKFTKQLMEVFIMDINQLWICVILTYFGASMCVLTRNLNSCVDFMTKNRQITKTKKKEEYFKISMCSFVYAFIIISFILFFRRNIPPIYTLLDVYKYSFVFVAPACFMVILVFYAVYYFESITGKVNVIRNAEYKSRKVVLGVFEVLLVTSFIGTLLIK